MNNKELADKVAKKLGWKELPNDIEAFILSWTTVGLVIEDAKDKGWMLIVTPEWVWFQTDQFSHYGILPTEHECLKEHGYVKAILLAYLEIPIKELKESKIVHRVVGKEYW